MINLGEIELVSYRHQGVLWPCRGRTPERFVLVWPPNSKNPHPQKKKTNFEFVIKCVSTGNSKEEDWVRLNLPILST